MLQTHIEALIFASEQPVGLEDIKHCLEEVFEAEQKPAEIAEAVEQIRLKYSSDAFPFEVCEINGGYQFMTKPSHHNVLAVYLKQRVRKRLSQSALESLSIIAYKQPVSKSDVEQIRGVNCDYVIQKLLEKELIMIVGRAETPGKPLLYATSEKFMDYFGLKSIADLPKLKDFPSEDQAIGDAPEIMETPADTAAINPSEHETTEEDESAV